MAFRVRITTLLAVIVTLQCATALDCRSCQGPKCVGLTSYDKDKETETCVSPKNSCGMIQFGNDYAFKGCVVKNNFCDDDKDGTKLKRNYKTIWDTVKNLIGEIIANDLLKSGQTSSICCSESNCNSSANTLVATGSIFFLIIGTLLGIFG